MKKTKWLCGLLILILLLSSCQAASPTDGTAESTAESTAETEEEKFVYVKQYPYPEGVEYTAYMTTTDGDPGRYVCDGIANLTQSKKQPRFSFRWQDPPSRFLEDMEKYLTITFLNESYECSYLYSTFQTYGNDWTHRYEGENVTFYVSAKTGAVTGYYRQDVELGYRGDISPQKLIEKGKAFVTEKLGLNVEDYRAVHDTEYVNPNFHHTVSFIKQASDYDTADIIKVRYSDIGIFWGYEQWMPNEFSEPLSWSLSEEQADAIAMACAEDDYIPNLTRQEDKAVFEVLNRRWIRGDNGELGILYTLGVWKNKKDGCHDVCYVVVFDTEGVTPVSD